jgi:dTMP kinase
MTPRGASFVTVEGGDGAGKTTLVSGLAASLSRRGLDVLVLREPGGTWLGEELRRLLLDPRSEIGAPAEALLYAAARAELVSEAIRPALAKGQMVLCDRFVESSLAYQGAGRELGLDWVRGVNELAIGGLRADLVLILDVDPAIGLSRQRARRGEADRIEGSSHELHERVRRCFLDLAGAEPDRFVVIDAGSALEVVLEEALLAIEKRLR